MTTHRASDRTKTALAGAAVVALSAGIIGGVAAPAQAAPGNDAVIQEFSTPGDAGWFYTANPSEAASAAAKYKFTKTADIGRIHSAPVPGGIAVHRLRHNGGGPSYMLSISPSEQHSPAFTDEGVLGYVDGAQKPGEVRLVRWSNHGKWRVLAEGAANDKGMKAAGYSLDGPVGWYSA